jgi:hypothetical protein
MEKEQTTINDLEVGIKKRWLSVSYKKLFNAEQRIFELSGGFEERLETYVQGAGKTWIEIADVLSRLPGKDFSKLSTLRPRANYLVKYRLLTLTNEAQKPGDIFVDLVTCNGPLFVWSPLSPEKFRKWKENATPGRSLKYVSDLSAYCISGMIQPLNYINPNDYIVRCLETML